MTVHDLLMALMLPSADDAAEDLAYNVGDGSVARFIAMMNARARQLGLTHTHYSTPIGLDTPGNYSSAYDLVKLADYELDAQPFFARIVAGRARSSTRARSTTSSTATTWSLASSGSTASRPGTPPAPATCSSPRARGRDDAAERGARDRASIPARDANTLALLDWGYRQLPPGHAGEGRPGVGTAYRSPTVRGSARG